MKTTILCLAVILALCGFDLNQERTITGKVTDSADGSPIPGVSITLKGTARGVVTDALGKYSITVPAAGGTLVFTFIGYVSREVRIGKDNVINMRLVPDIMVLQEEVV